ncbi:alpha/beta hydrolase-fold protein [Corynebacterium freiburgense]|uniref:alpha/beta hydrolase-fold protein n=1 Tax=Corynebacterium freiburgense TaxID=556548 RepID=UPI0004217382|nr:alpha/beta hydrolase-fold protein [Corynebacterium freiburgense]WJZ03865.1 Diacylglycerol acyltransferase/mycolyltransferase Ag85C precursor [Corynebacterium freiburgense]
MRHSRFARRISRIAALLVPLTLLAPTPIAAAQTSAPSANLAPSDGITGYLEGGEAPQRTPIRTDHPDIGGLPSGVDVDRVEWLTDRRIAVYIKSAAMPEKPIQVQILLARDWHSNKNANFPEVWALDGLRALEEENGWTLYTNIEEYFADKNVNVILPVGGESSFYTDWEKPDNGKNYKWETFLTQELPAVLKNGYRSNGQRAVFGISMGGTAAMNLAQHRPDMFNFVGSFSGYLDTTSSGMPAMIDAAMKDGGGYSAEAMWGPYGSQRWIDNDPKQGIEALKGKTVYVSAGSGRDDYGEPGSVADRPAEVSGMGLEVISRMTTQTFVDRAKKANVPVTAMFRPSGIHNWPYWQFELTQAWPHIADSLAIEEKDRGAECTAGGAIGEKTKDGAFGSCLNNEYDVPGGRAQDFRNGRAYWSDKTGAHVLIGRIAAHYSEIGATESWLGFPVTGELTAPDGVGRFVNFEHGAIYWTPETNAHAIPTDMKEAWGRLKYEQGVLKYPTSDPKDISGHLVQQFQGGYVIRTKDQDAFTVQGIIAQKYGELDTVNSQLGAPKSNEKPVNGGAMQEFEHGKMYWSPETGAHFVLNGDIQKAWDAKGGEQGEFGFPISDQEKIPAGGEMVTFQRGVIKQVNGRIVEEKK